MSKQMTMGVLVGNRGFFPSHLATSGRLEIIAALEAAGIKPIVLTPEVTAHGAVETYEDAKKCAALFKSHAADIDGLIITLPNFGEERGLADAIRLADLRVPVLIQATPDAPAKMSIAHRRDSFCGKMSICNNLTQYGIPYSLTTLHTEAARLARVRRRPRLVRRRLPRRSRPEEPPHRRHRRASHGIQHRPLLGKITGAQRHHRRNPRPQRSHGPHRAHEGHRRRGASQARGHQKIHPRRLHARSRSAQDGQARRGHRRLEGSLRTVRHLRPVLDQHRGVPRHRSLHRHVHDERGPLRLGLRGRHPRHALHARPRARQPDALRPARLEQQLRRGPRQGRLLPLLQPSQTLLQPRRKDGLSAHHRRHGRQGRTPTARSMAASRPAPCPSPASPPTTSPARSRATSAREHSPTTRSSTFGGAGVVHIPNMQELLRYICLNGFEHHVAASFSTSAAAIHEAATRYLNWPTHWHK